jgi:hypothetical protein
MQWSTQQLVGNSAFYVVHSHRDGYYTFARVFTEFAIAHTPHQPSSNHQVENVRDLTNSTNELTNHHFEVQLYPPINWACNFLLLKLSRRSYECMIDD